MAAHVLTALDQIIADPEANYRCLDAALNLSCWTEQLSLEEYAVLTRIAEQHNSDVLLGWALALRPYYYQAWLHLDCPPTLEEWVNRQYREIVKPTEP